ncbi:MAG: transcription termination/antitermination protein NusG [Lachnospirales bacterium]
MSNSPEWYVVHTYSGYENKVKTNIEKLVENRGMQDQILEISVPMRDEVEIKNGQKKVVQRKVFHGYVLIRMIMNDDTWYVVRNTRGVTSFVGPGSKPIPLTDEEVKRMGIGQAIESSIDFEIGEVVAVSSELFGETKGAISEINTSKRTITVDIEAFGGRSTPTEFDIAEVRKV